MAGNGGKLLLAGREVGGKVQVRGVSGMKSGGRPTAAFCAASSFVCPKRRPIDGIDIHDDLRYPISLYLISSIIQSWCVVLHGSMELYLVSSRRVRRVGGEWHFGWQRDDMSWRQRMVTLQSGGQLQ